MLALSSSQFDPLADSTALQTQCSRSVRISSGAPFHDRARYHALPAAAPASRMIPASCGSPGREPRNPARDVGPEILVLRSELMNEQRLLVPHDKRVEGEPHQHTVRKKALVAEQGRLA